MQQVMEKVATTIGADISPGLLLTWEYQAELEQSLHAAEHRLLGRLAQQLGSFLGSKGSGSIEISDIRHRFSRLSDDAIRRILLAPSVHQALTKPSDGPACLANLLLAAITAEECRAGALPSLPFSVWSADGSDHYAQQDRQSLLQDDSNSSHRYAAPRVGNVVLDFVSPFVKVHHGSMSEKPGLTNLLKQPDVDGVVSRIIAACKAIESANPGTSIFVLQTLRSIVCLEANSQPASFRSMSSRDLIGQAILINPHLDRISIATIADALIHESVHSFLYEREQSGRWVLDPLADHLLRSPWSGNILRLESFLHACFVWFALLKFWRTGTCTRWFDPTEVERLALRAERGFAANSVMNSISMYAFNIRAGVSEHIKWLCDNAFEEASV